MKRIIPFLIFFLTFFFSQNKSIAQPNIGAEITWQCVGQDSFMVTLTKYRDCAAITLGNAYIYAKCQSGFTNLGFLTMTQPTGIDITPACDSLPDTKCQTPSAIFPYGIEKYVYSGLLVLNSTSSCCNIMFYHQTCCRPTGLFSGAGASAFYVNAKLNRCVSPCDNSPVFEEDPIYLLCVNQDFVFRNHAVDPDVDANGNPLDSLCL